MASKRMLPMQEGQEPKRQHQRDEYHESLLILKVEQECEMRAFSLEYRVVSYSSVLSDMFSRVPVRDGIKEVTIYEYWRVVQYFLEWARTSTWADFSHGEQLEHEEIHYILDIYNFAKKYGIEPMQFDARDLIEKHLGNPRDKPCHVDDARALLHFVATHDPDFAQGDPVHGMLIQFVAQMLEQIDREDDGFWRDFGSMPEILIELLCYASNAPIPPRGDENEEKLEEVEDGLEESSDDSNESNTEAEDIKDDGALECTCSCPCRYP